MYIHVYKINNNNLYIQVGTNTSCFDVLLGKQWFMAGPTCTKCLWSAVVGLAPEGTAHRDLSAVVGLTPEGTAHKDLSAVVGPAPEGTAHRNVSAAAMAVVNRFHTTRFIVCCCV